MLALSRLAALATASPTPHGPVRVLCTNCASHDMLDYAGAFAGVLSAILAFVALAIARQSAGDSKRSAAAAQRTADAADASAELTRALAASAEQQLAMQRAEHDAFMAESNRRPDLAPTFQPIKTFDERSVVVQWGVTNTGDKTAEGVVVLLIVPSSVVIESSNAEGLDRLPNNTIPQAGTLAAGEHTLPVHSVNMNADAVPGIQKVSWKTLTFPAFGVYDVLVRVVHRSLEAGSSDLVQQVSVTPDPRVEEASAG